VVKEKQK